MTKKRSPKDSPPPSGVERYTVGDGLTKIEKIRVIPSPETMPIIESFFRQDFTFTGRIAFAEKWAVKVLQDAKLPTDPKGLYGIPDGLPAAHIGERIPGRTGIGTFLAIVEARGYREREHKEMYAAMILSDAARLRGMLSRMKADPEAARKEADALAMLAFDLGLLVYEAIGFKFPHEADALRGIKVIGGAKSEKPPRRIIELEECIRSRRRDEELTYKEFKEELESTEDGDPLEWSGFLFWVDEGRVYVQEKPERNGDEEKKARSISVESLTRYWNYPPSPAI